MLTWTHADRGQRRPPRRRAGSNNWRRTKKKKITSAQSQLPRQVRSAFRHKMAKLKDKRREKISVATEVRRLKTVNVS